MVNDIIQIMEMYEIAAETMKLKYPKGVSSIPTREILNDMYQNGFTKDFFRGTEKSVSGKDKEETSFSRS
jgi:hypothetical protein